MDNNQTEDLQLFNTSVHSVHGKPVNWLPLPDFLGDPQSGQCNLQHLMDGSRFYIAQVHELAQSICLWRTKRQYCIKNASREATLYHLTEGAKPSELRATCMSSDGALLRPFRMQPCRTFPLFAADLLPLPFWANGASVQVGPSRTVIGRIRPAWGPVKAFWLGDSTDGRKFQVQSERLMDFCCNGDTTELEPLEIYKGSCLCCVASMHRQVQLRSVYCQDAGMEVSFVDCATADLTAEDRLLLLCGLIFAWQQIG